MIGMRIRRHSLSIFFAVLFVLALIGQSIAGLVAFNEEQLAHGAAAVTWSHFVTSSDFVVDLRRELAVRVPPVLPLHLRHHLARSRRVDIPNRRSPATNGIGSDEQQKVGRYAEPSSRRGCEGNGMAPGRSTALHAHRPWARSSVDLVARARRSRVHTRSSISDRSSHGQQLLTIGEYLVAADFWNRTCRTGNPSSWPSAAWWRPSIVLRQRGSSDPSLWELHITRAR